MHVCTVALFIHDRYVHARSESRAIEISKDIRAQLTQKTPNTRNLRGLCVSFRSCARHRVHVFFWFFGDACVCSLLHSGFNHHNQKRVAFVCVFFVHDCPFYDTAHDATECLCVWRCAALCWGCMKDSSHVYTTV